MRRLYYNDDEFSQAFQSLKDYREVPPVGNWRAINARLDKRKAFRYTRVIGVAAVLGVVVTLGLSIYFSTEPARLRTQALKQENLARPPVMVEPPATGPFSKKSPTGSTDHSKEIDGVNNALENIHAALATMDVRPHDVIQPLRVNRRSSFAEPLRMLDYHAYELLTGFKTAGTSALSKEELITNDPSCAPFYVGLNIQPQHTMLTSSNAINDPDVNYKFSPGLAYGISAGYRLSNTWALEAGGMLSMENNRYEASREQQAKALAHTNSNPEPSASTMQQHRLALTYYRIPLMVKFRMPWNPRHRSICEESVSLIAGMQYGYFRNGFNTNLDAHPETESTDVVTEDIKRSDVQVLTGVERSSALTRNFAINYGFRVGYGLRQISSLETERITRFNNPHNLSAAFNLSLTFSK